MPIGDDQPLRGRRIMVTRPREQSSELSELLAGLGADVVQIPAIRVQAASDPSRLRHAVRGAPKYDWIVLTSVNGVDFFAAAVEEVAREDAEPVQLPSLCAIGPATGGALIRYFGRADLVARVHTAEGVVEALTSHGEVAGRRFLLPLAAGARDVLATSLRDRGGEVDQVEAYRTVVDSSSAEGMRRTLESGRVDMITFTSASSVRGVLELGGMPDGVAIAAIGPVTANAARAEGMHVDIEAHPHSVPGLVAAITRFYATSREQ